MRTENQQLFTLPTKQNSFSQEDYKEVKPYLETVEAFSRASNQCVYVIDLLKRKFLYVSGNPVFLCGNNPREIIRMGYQFYKQFVHTADFNLFENARTNITDFYNALSVYDRQNYAVSFDARLQPLGGMEFLVNQKLTLLALKEHRPWLALCIVTQSSAKAPGNILIHRNSGGKSFIYDPTQNKWQTHKKTMLSPKEKLVLALCAKGCTSGEVAKELNISGATVKFHKKNIFKKLQVKNIAEAISMAISYGLIK